jgi:hypothetical protein
LLTIKKWSSSWFSNWTSRARRSRRKWACPRNTARPLGLPNCRGWPRALIHILGGEEW